MVGTPVVEMRGTPHPHIMEPPTLLFLLIPEPGWDWEPKGQVATRMFVGPWYPLVGGLALLPPVLLLVGGTSVTEPSTEGHKGKTKAGRWCPHVLAAQGGAVPSPAVVLQGRARTLKPSPLPFLHSPWHVLGGKGEQQEQGWPCVPSWQWRAAPPQRGRLYLFLPPAGRNKGLFVLWRVWSLQEEW